MKKENFGLIFTHENILYLLLSKQEEENTFNLKAFVTKEKAIESFKPFYDSLNRNYESHISAGMGLTLLKPCVIKYPDDPKDIEKYIIPSTFTKIKGSIFGAHLDLYAIEVKPNIKKLIAFEITYNTIQMYFKEKEVIKTLPVKEFSIKEYDKTMQLNPGKYLVVLNGSIETTLLTYNGTGWSNAADISYIYLPALKSHIKS